MLRITPATLRSVTAWFEDNFHSRGELGASVSIWQNGEEILSLAQGWCDRQNTRPWTAETLVPVFSATKAAAALCCLLALEKARLPLESPVAEVWPEFAGGGKSTLQFAHLLSHTAGLCALDERVPIFNYQEVIAALERQVPLWEPGRQQGYHARTFGFLMDEIVRRITGADSLGEYFREVIGSPLGLEFWIGLPSAQWERVSPLYPGKVSLANSDQPFFKAFNSRDSLTHRTFTSPLGVNAVSEYNQSAFWAHGYASMGGVSTAQALGKFYAMLAQGGIWNGHRYVSEAILRQFGQTLSQEDDSVLLTPIAFAAGVMHDPRDPDPRTEGEKLRQHFGPSFTAYGHPGAGGCLAFADPENGIALAYTMNQMEVGALPGLKVLGMVDRLYGV